MSLLRHPRLPEGEATHVLASGEFPWLAEALERRGLTVVATQRDSRLPGPVQFHPDLQTCPLPDKQMFVLKNSPLQPALKALGFSLRETQCEPSGTYPGDALCGCFPWGPWLVGNPKAIDRAIAQEAFSRCQSGRATARVPWRWWTRKAPSQRTVECSKHCAPKGLRCC